MSDNELADRGAAGDADRLTGVARALLGWFAANRRDLPWRSTRDPYRILVSEIMLQQTQVDRVIPYYQAFLERFPTAAALAAAPTAEVIRLWAGLGYNRRAVNLQRAARAVVEEHAGVWPSDVAGLRALPGIGPYTAGAIACFAFERDVAFLDTNMRRVIHRVFFGPDLPSPTASERELLAVAADVVPPDEGWLWNQALIEFGALHCTARKPACVVCPLGAYCRARPAMAGAIAATPKGVRKKREEIFAGSNRYYRGRAVDALRELGGASAEIGIPLRELGPLVKSGFTEADLPWLRGLVDDLTRDGLAAVAEDAPPYHADGVDRPESGFARVRLPR
ncbi:MAG: A/G-specific adenine glycosylase [Thermomicrobiales bacterium]|nr:A/G-specific adenine glycosylase [Thermomicrobiales bacterium]